MAQVTVTIDGKEITVMEGATILEAAQLAGIFIPTLCHDPELTKTGACRMCVVEVNGGSRLLPSCATAVTEGMQIRTDTDAVLEARRTILELLLANHPEDCMTCQKAGDCKLADYAYLYGVRKPKNLGYDISYEIDDSSPVILRDPNKCILCGKCVRVCEEIQGRHVVDFTYRGIRTTVGPAFELGLGESECVGCGSCVAVCPVGALVEKGMVGKGRPYQVTKVKTTCTYCGCGCNFDLNVVNGKVIGVTSNPESEVNGRHLCIKGRFGYDFIHSPERLTKPLIRKDGELKEASWEEALDLVAEKLADIRDKFGGQSLAVLTSARCTNEENYLMSKLARAGLNTNNIDHCARL